MTFEFKSVDLHTAFVSKRSDPQDILAKLEPKHEQPPVTAWISPASFVVGCFVVFS